MEKLNLDQVISIQQQKLINHKFSLENAFQETLYRIDNWINEGSGWTSLNTLMFQLLDHYQEVLT